MSRGYDTKNQHIYFIKAKCRPPVVKIGMATMLGLSDRLRVLRAMSPVELKLLHYCPGGRRDEINLHKKFSHLKHHGEWFYFTYEIEEYIESIKEKDAVTNADN